MKRNRPIHSIIVTTVVTALGLVVGLAPAESAHANDGHCGPGDVCLYEDPYLSGGLNDNSGAILDYSRGERFWGTNRSINDAVSSARNRGRFCTVRLYEHSYTNGRSIPIAAGNDRSNLAWDNFDNIASSHYWFC
jgi:hypothetical protein